MAIKKFIDQGMIEKKMKLGVLSAKTVFRYSTHKSFEEVLLSDEDSFWIIRHQNPTEGAVTVTSLDGKHTMKRDEAHSVIKHEIVVSNIQKKEPVLLSKLQPGNFFCVENENANTLWMVCKTNEAQKANRIETMQFCSINGSLSELSKRERDADLLVVLYDLDIEIKDAFEKKA